MAPLVFRWLLAGVFIFAGAMHLLRPSIFLLIMPPWMPGPLACVKISGICEILGGLGLISPFPELRFWAAWGLVALLIAVFPANIYMATHHIRVNGFPSRAWMAWARLPLQPILIWLVLWSARII
jgi:uncharacterized membrane protein